MSSSTEKIKWQPLESNPLSLTQYIHKLGVSDDYEVIDIYSLDPETFEFYPKPILALIALFPLNEDLSSPIRGVEENKNDQVVFINQTIGNACGTMAIFHSILNNLDEIKLAPGALKDYYESNKTKSSKERSILLENSSELASLHQEFSELGQTEAMDKDSDLDLHFVTFVEKEGHLIELDGRKNSAFNHGACTKDELLNKAAIVLKNVMKENSGRLDFSLLALAKVG